MAYKAYDPEIAARKRRNVEIFEETLKICLKGFYVSPAGARIELPPMDEVLAASEFYRNPPKVDDIPTCVVSTVDVVNADCVGDAFGSPIQFSGKDSHPWITEMVACPVFRLPPGYWTDDGSMAMCVMDSYVRKGGYDLRDIGATFVRRFSMSIWRASARRVVPARS